MSSSIQMRTTAILKHQAQSITITQKCNITVLSCVLRHLLSVYSNRSTGAAICRKAIRYGCIVSDAQYRIFDVRNRNTLMFPAQTGGEKSYKFT